MVGQHAEVQDWQGTTGHVFVRGERWNAVAGAPQAVGSRVRVTARDGLTLTVSAVAGAPADPALAAPPMTHAAPSPLTRPR